jgi:predicted transcriptional regulator
VARFGDLEAAIMDRVWAAAGPMRVRDVLNDLQRDGREVAYTTVQTVMEILCRKGWLDRAKDGRAFRYLATASAEEYAARLIDEALAAAPDRTAALVHFFDRLDEAEVAELRAALAAALMHRRTR